MKPRDFAVYSFLVSRKDSVGECWYSVERIAEYCNISVNTARRALHWLEEWGYIEIKKSFLGGVQQTNLYEVHKIVAWHQIWESNNMKTSPINKIKRFWMGPENFVIRFTHNKKPIKRKKNKLNKLIKTDIKLDLWAFVKVTGANEINYVFYCFIQSNE